LKALVRLAPAWRSSGEGQYKPAANKIEFNYLNGNLMVPKIHPLTLTFDRNSRKGGQLLFDGGRNHGFDDDVVPTSLPCTRQKIVGRGRVPMRVSGEHE
jgi:hypothetical protein